MAWFPLPRWSRAKGDHVMGQEHMMKSLKKRVEEKTLPFHRLGALIAVGTAIFTYFWPETLGLQWRFADLLLFIILMRILTEATEIKLLIRTRMDQAKKYFDKIEEEEAKGVEQNESSPAKEKKDERFQ